jgi:hemolysin activation/secretion protein
VSRASRLKGYYGLTLGLTLSSLCLGLLLPAFADTTSIPQQVNPGLLTPPSNINAIPTNPDKPEKTPETKLDVPESTSNIQLQADKFKLNKIELTGQTLLKKEDTAPLFSQVEGKEVTLNDMQSLVEKLNQLYRDKGFLTSQVIIPPQDINEGNLKLEAVEGRIGKLSVSGNRYYRAWAIRRNIDEKEGTPLNLRALEKNLNRLNQQQAYRLRATLSPGAKTGETDVRLDVAERQPWQISPTFDNQGRPFIGTMRWGTEVSNQNLFGVGDRLFTKWIMARRTQVAIASYTVPINRFGDEINANFSFSHVNVDLNNVRNQQEIIGKAYNYGLVYSHPFDKNRMFVGDVGFVARRISTFLDGDKARQDDIRSIQTGLTFNKYDRNGRTYARAQMTFAPGWMGADQKFFKTELSATRLIRLPKNNLIILRAYGQLTPDALPAAEQFQLGGAYSVRGYSEGLLVGDRGYNLSIEHRWPVPFLRNASPWLADRVQGATFFDMGGTYQDKNAARYIGGTSGSARRTFLAGAGVGLRIRLTRFLSGFVDCGFGLSDRGNIEPYAQPTARVHFGLRSDLLSENLRTYTGTEAETTQAKKEAAAAAKKAKPVVAPVAPVITTPVKSEVPAVAPLSTSFEQPIVLPNGILPALVSTNN